MIKTLYVDFDGVIVNTIQCIVKLYNDDHGYCKDFIPVNWIDVDTWKFEELNLEPYSVIDRYFSQPRFFRHVKWMDNAEEILQRLSKQFDIKVVSIGTRENLIGKQLWMLKNMPYAKLIPVLIGEDEDKSDVDMSDGILFDDSISNLISCNAKYKVCFGEEYSWNKDWDGDRCVNWRDAEDYIREKVMLYD